MENNTIQTDLNNAIKALKSLSETIKDSSETQPVTVQLEFTENIRKAFELLLPTTGYNSQQLIENALWNVITQKNTDGVMIHPSNLHEVSPVKMATYRTLYRQRMWIERD